MWTKHCLSKTAPFKNNFEKSFTFASYLKGRLKKVLPINILRKTNTPLRAVKRHFSNSSIRAAKKTAHQYNPNKPEAYKEDRLTGRIQGEGRKAAEQKRDSNFP